MGWGLSAQAGPWVLPLVEDLRNNELSVLDQIGAQGGAEAETKARPTGVGERCGLSPLLAPEAISSVWGAVVGRKVWPPRAAEAL